MRVRTRWSPSAASAWRQVSVSNWCCRSWRSAFSCRAVISAVNWAMRLCRSSISRCRARSSLRREISPRLAWAGPITKVPSASRTSPLVVTNRSPRPTVLLSARASAKVWTNQVSPSRCPSSGRNGSWVRTSRSARPMIPGRPCRSPRPGSSSGPNSRCVVAFSASRRTKPTRPEVWKSPVSIRRIKRLPESTMYCAASPRAASTSGATSTPASNKSATIPWTSSPNWLACCLAAASTSWTPTLKPASCRSSSSSTSTRCASPASLPCRIASSCCRRATTRRCSAIWTVEASRAAFFWAASSARPASTVRLAASSTAWLARVRSSSSWRFRARAVRFCADSTADSSPLTRLPRAATERSNSKCRVRRDSASCRTRSRWRVKSAAAC